MVAEIASDEDCLIVKVGNGKFPVYFKVKTMDPDIARSKAYERMFGMVENEPPSEETINNHTSIITIRETIE